MAKKWIYRHSIAVKPGAEPPTKAGHSIYLSEHRCRLGRSGGAVLSP
jgi:hypothetical protein